jgi:metallo-beta-lactamase class B
VESLGFRWADTKILLNGQAHFDHMAGAAEVLRETHARDMVMDGDSEVVRSGGRKDFAFGTDGIKTYAPGPCGSRSPRWRNSALGRRCSHRT